MEPDVVTRRAPPMVRLVGFDRRLAADDAAPRPMCCSPTLATAVAAIASAGAGVEDARAAPGDLDPAFGDVGRVSNLGQPTIWSLDVLDDGDVIFGAGDEYCSYWYAGCFPSSGFGRLLASGAPDPAFTAATLQDTTIFDTALQDDGSLVAVGHKLVNDQFRLVVVRLLPDGSLDPQFGADGTQLLPGATMGAEFGRAIQLEDDGRIVVAGTRGEQVLLARLTADGDLDATFGSGGVTLHGTAVANVVALARTATGYRVVANAALDRPGSFVQTCQVFGVLADGRLDTTFGDAGSGTRTLYVNDFSGQTCDSGGAQLDGRLVVGGGPGPFGDDGFLMRLLVDGTADASFKTTPLADVLPNATAIAFGSGGRIYVAGSRNEGLGGATVVRLLADGTLDTAYGKDGASDFVLPTGAPVSAVVRDLASGPGGTLLVSGGMPYWSNGFVARLLGDGPGGGPGVLSVVSGGVLGTEGQGQATIAVRRLAGSTGPVSVGYRTRPYSARPSAEEGQDYAPVSGTLTWADGESGDRDIVVPILSDALTEVPEYFEVELHGADGGAGLGATVSQVHIAGTSYPAGSIQFAAGANSMREGLSQDIQVVRDEYSSGQVSVTVRITGGTAQLDSDYSGADATLTWSDGEMGAKSFRLTGRADREDEGPETITLELVSPTGGAILGALQQSTVSIVDVRRLAAAENGGGHTGALGTTLLGLLAWLRRWRTPQP
ncbi:MAG TPA: Calx-beta domain-containing protein [Steroidobacteraceae bacterium]|nr:Calx-beta domain-containing protein [Steroidobacteraceae bacterium]